MKIVGQEKSSFIDYPDKICTVYFLPFCNFKCQYCHNAHVIKGKGQFIKEEEVFNFLHKRKRYIDAVCISGGEPTLHEDLYEFIKKIKSEDFLVKLDTNGTNPKILERLIKENLLDYIAMDIKAPFDKYEFVTDVKINLQNIKDSIDIIRSSSIDYEFRTTVCKELISKEDILKIAEYLKGSRRYSVQNFKDGETVLAGGGHFTPYDLQTLEEIQKELVSYFEKLIIRK